MRKVLLCSLLLPLLGCPQTREREALRQRVISLEQERGVLQAQVSQLSEQQEQRKRAQSAADARAGALRVKLARFKSMLATGRLQVHIEKERMLLALPGEILFEPGKAELRKESRWDLEQVTAILVGQSGKRIYEVLGHADAQESKAGGFRDAWELSAQRALVVTRFMVARGMPAAQLAAVGVGDGRPLTGVEGAEAKRRSRRVEISLVPDLSLEAPPESPRYESSGPDSED